MSEQKFCKNDEVSEYLHHNIKDVLQKRRNLSSNSEIINTKHLTQCNKRLMYRVSGVNLIESKKDAFDFQEELQIINKRYLHNKWISILKEIDKVEIIAINESFADCNCNLIGYTDILKVGLKNVIFEVEYIDEVIFKDVLTNGAKRCNVVDIMSKMWMSNIKHGILIYETSNNYKIFHVTPFDYIIKSVCNKCSELMNYKILGKLPDRSYENIKEECMVCEYKEICWK